MRGNKGCASGVHLFHSADRGSNPLGFRSTRAIRAIHRSGALFRSKSFELCLLGHAIQEGTASTIRAESAMDSSEQNLFAPMGMIFALKGR